jgi:hypothetical protein
MGHQGRRDLFDLNAWLVRPFMGGGDMIRRSPQGPSSLQRCTDEI